MTMLGDPHGPAGDDALGLGVELRRMLDLAAAQARLLFDGGPLGVFDHLQPVRQALGVLGNEGMVKHTARLRALPGQQALGHAAHRGHVSAQVGAEVGAAGRVVAISEHFQGVLRVLKTFQAPFFQGVEADHAGAAFDRFAQRFKHARMVGAGVLAKHEDGVGLGEIGEGHRALAHPDALAEGHAAGFVAQVGTIGKVVGAVAAHKQLIKKCGLVAGPAGCVELGLVGAVQAAQHLANQGEGGVPANRQIAVGGRVIGHGLGQAALLFQPVITLFAQLGHAVAGKERRADATLGRLPVDRLGAVLAELDHAAVGRLAPGATGAVEAAILVGLEQGAQVLERLLAGQPVLGDAAQGTPAGGGAGIGLVAGLVAHG